MLAWRNLIVGGGLVAFVFGVYSYSLSTIRQGAISAAEIEAFRREKQQAASK